MSSNDPAWIEHQRRWLRPDWQRWMRHDAHLFAPPDPNAYRSYASRLVEQMREEEEQAAIEAELLDARRQLAEIKFELAWRRICRKYREDQPRVPKGNPDGGQWTDDEQLTGGTRIASLNDPRVISDAPPPGMSGQSPGKVQLAAMSWEQRVRAIFGQKDLFTEVGAEEEEGAPQGFRPSKKEDQLRGFFEALAETILSS
jgi:hypothetical protein